MVIKKIGVLSAAKIEGLMCAIIGLFAGIIVFLVSSALQSVFQSTEFGSSGMMTGGAGMLIILPIIYGVLGFVGGAISAFLYNLIAGWIGGLEIEMGEKAVVVPQPEQPKM